MNWPLLFKLHRTQWLLGDNAAGSLRLLEVDRAKVIAWNNSERRRMKGGNDWRVLNPDNLFGRILLMGDITPASLHLGGHLKELSRSSATETVLKLRLYFVEHGALPATLDALVPVYRPAVPLDYYDRAPIRYSSTNFAVWSVEPDNINVTIPNPDEEDTFIEIYIRLDFAAPLRPAPPTENPAQS